VNDEARPEVTILAFPELLGGSIDVVSQVGAGSTFTV
jgi:hypothetical protein